MLILAALRDGARNEPYSIILPGIGAENEHTI